MQTVDIINTVRRKILEKTQENVSSETILQYANDGYMEIYKQLFLDKEVVTEVVDCAAGVCALPTDYGTAYTTAKGDNGQEFEEYTIADFNQKNIGNAFTIDGGRLLINSDAVSRLTVKYYRQPALLSDTADPAIDPLFHECIVYEAVWRCFEDLQETIELAGSYRRKASELLARKIAIQSTYEKNNQTGGQMFQYQNLVF